MKKTLLLLLVSGALAHSAAAQSQQVPEPYRKWLDCFVDWIFSEEEVGSTFSIQISFREAPVAGVRIELEREGQVAATARTNSHGVARFSAIPPGEYWPRAGDGLAFPRGSQEIKVVLNHPNREKLKLEWPADAMSVRGVRGRLTTSELLDDPDVPMQNHRVDLLDLRTARLVESVQTNANGEYEFKTAEPGLYALRVSLPMKGEQSFESHDLAIEVTPAASDYSLPEMKVAQSDCNGVQFYRRSNRADWTWEQQ